ncbi:Retrovirus-related Pol polyprotein from transposon [Dictyocoela muelleri]|nr:Retrovirus-related Pol polyprotein from transposon [Dictyocoela muelleri]
MRREHMQSYQPQAKRNNRSTLNKTYFNKSIYLNFLVQRCTFGADQFILNSRKEIKKLLSRVHEEIESIKKTIQPSEKFDQATFEYKNDLTGLKMLHKINILSSIEQQDVLSWTCAFREISRVCGWSLEAQIDVLKHIVSIEIQYKIGPPNEPNSYLNLLLKQKYNDETSYKYHERLMSFRQSNFITIRKYLSEIEINCQKIGICLGWDNQLVVQKVHEVFFNGLANETKLELSKYFKKDFKSIYESILTTECMLIENLNKEVMKYGNEYDTDTFQSQNERKYKEKGFSPKHPVQRKFCSYHKSHSHNDVECRARKQKDKKEYVDNSDKKLMSLQEPKPVARTIHIPITYNDKEYKAILDTGSELNYVSNEIIIENDKAIINETGTKTIELANGTCTKTSSYIEDYITVFNDQRLKIKEKFYSLSGLNYPFLLGMEFILKNNIVLDVKNQIIKIDDCEFELELKGKTLPTYDNQLLEKTRIFKTSINEEKMNKLISKFKGKGPILGEIKNIEHNIELNGTFEPPKGEYCVPISIKDDVKKHLEELEKYKIIKKKDTQFISPAFFVRKSNRKLRLIVDYRNLNKVTTKAHNFRPKIMDILYSLNGCKYFSKIDLNQGFYQIKISKNDQEKTGFRVLGNTYVFRRMPFGLTNAPFTFQLALSKIIQKLPNTYFYIDDILIASKEFDTHLLDVERVLKRLNDNNVAVNWDKCEFGKREITFLGHIICEKGLKPEISKIENFKYKTPTTRNQLEKLLGFINWFRTYLPNLTDDLTSIYDKLKCKRKYIEWHAEDDEKLNKIFQEIKKQNVLHFPDLTNDFDLKCDASDFGIGAVLSQRGRVNGFYSRKLKGSELNYTIVEKEVLSILEALRHFKSIIFGSKINIYTDNKNLTFKGDISKRTNRWLLMLEEYNYTLNHISSKNNNDADILSRAFIIKNSRFDDLLNNINQIIIKIKKSENNKETIKKYFTSIHELLIHPGKNKMMATLKNYIYMKSMRKIISEICKNCKKCNEEKIYYSPKILTKFVTEPFNRHETIAIDIKGPVKTSHFETKKIETNIYVVAITDMFSRYTEIKFIDNIHSLSVCNAIENMWLKVHITPKNCLTDNGRQFTSENFGNLMRKYNIKHIRTSPHNPTGNSIIERINREISVALRLSRSLNLKNATENIWKRINLTNNSTLGFAPYEIFFKKPLFETHNKNFIINDNKIKSIILEKQNQWSQRKGINPMNIKENDLVYIKCFNPDKITPKFTGPYKISSVSKSGNSVYVKKNNNIVKVATKNLKLFKKGENVAVQDALQY